MSTLTWDRRGLAKAQEELAKGAIAALADSILEAARATVRSQAYDTGELHDSLVAIIFVDGRRVHGPAIEPPALEGRGIEAFVVATAAHARFVHDGTVDTEAVPFLRMAASRAAL